MTRCTFAVFSYLVGFKTYPPGALLPVFCAWCLLSLKSFLFLYAHHGQFTAFRRILTRVTAQRPFVKAYVAEYQRS